jgi:hypothetical protein
VLALKVDAGGRSAAAPALKGVAGVVDGALPHPTAVPVDDVVGGLGRTHISTVTTASIEPHASTLDRLGAQHWTMTPSTQTQPERWLRPQEAADYLGIGMGDLKRAKAAGIAYHQMETNNGLCLFLVSELDQWRRNHQRLPRTPPARVRRPRYRPRAQTATP